MSTAQRTVLFWQFSVIYSQKRQLYRDLNFTVLRFKNANFSEKREPNHINTLNVFRDIKVWNLKFEGIY